ncbi:P-loop containing nucleoside triphosphate hydrolase protein [Pelagophyceae sp. CCMP2097]|nr:P-loop containing nucleoside triphosphate hydrolase protein [Pelagophyceae sp. CCMP2097]|mmetsp:Transcript_6638/g.23722  ORF Transcript_6638/g.23722 Transcript_6638/m.23722 type:complete len:757 (-) Transcript_6638:48-2318(-)
MSTYAAVWPSSTDFVEKLLWALEEGALNGPEEPLLPLPQIPQGTGLVSAAEALRLFEPHVLAELLASVKDDAKAPCRLSGKVEVQESCELREGVFVARVKLKNPQKDESILGVLSEGSVVGFALDEEYEYGFVLSSRDVTPLRTDSWKSALVQFTSDKFMQAEFILEYEVIGDALTGVREYQALLALASAPAALLRPLLTKKFETPSAAPAIDEKRSALWTTLEKTYNPGQLRAIRAATRHHAGDDAYSLVQGPPGTGKTRTILGIVAIFLSDEYALAAQGSTKNSTGGGRGRGGSVRIVAGGAARGRTVASPSAIKALPLLLPRASRRVLVCAPSNAAVDEIVKRLRSDGIVSENGATRIPNVVRVGQAGGSQRKQNRGGRSQDNQTASGAALKLVNDVCLNNLKSAKEKIDALKAAEIVCCTLSGSGSSSLVDAALSAMDDGGRRKDPFFSAVIVDEAAQAVEPSAMIPLRYHPKRVVLVGDPKQLSATLKVAATSRMGYSQSLFSRLYSGQHAFSLLDVQYRMHPHICSFISKQFYTGRLESPAAATAPGTKMWDIAGLEKSPLLAPLCFHDVCYTAESKGGNSDSFCNVLEADFVAHLVKSAVRRTKGSLEIGVITFYKAQIDELRSRLRGHARVEVATVDAFQGREKDIIVLSCVRACGSSIGFLATENRINVAISRAKFAVWVCGSAETLKENRNWKALVDSAKGRNNLFKWLAPPNRDFDFALAKEAKPGETDDGRPAKTQKTNDKKRR